MRKIIIDENEKNQRFDRYVSKYLNKAGNSFIQKMIRKKNIELNGKKSDPKYILKKGDIVEFYLSEETINKFREEKNYVKTTKDLEVLYEDNNLVIINKPVAITMQPDKTNEISLLDMFLSYLDYDNKYKSKTFRPAFVNRLDKNTSGIVIGAKNYKALKSLNKFTREKKFTKNYKAIVTGRLKENQILQNHITRNNKISKVNNKLTGKKIITKIKPILNTKDYTLVDIELVTGRTHQIRAHLKSINHPLLGDNKYNIKKNQKDELYYLHAYRLIINEVLGDFSYLSGKSFECPLPNRFENKIKLIFGD